MLEGKGACVCSGGVLGMEKGLVRTLGSDSALGGEVLTVPNGLPKALKGEVA